MARNQGRHASGDIPTPMTGRIFRLIILQVCLLCSIVAHAPASVEAQSGTGLVAAYGFEEGSGTTLNDLSGNQNNGILQNGPVWVTTGKYGKALRFDGNDDLVTVSDSNSLDLTTSMTLEAWVNPTTTLASWDTILLKEQTNGLVYSLYANGDVNNPFTYIFSGGAEYGTGGGTSLPVNTWTHVAATFDGNVIRLFMNGTQVGSAPRTGSILTSNRGLGIGGNMVWRNESFPGLIDEVRIYNRVLTASEISLDMQTPVAGSIPTPSATASATASATRTSTPTRTFTPTRTPTVTPGPSATSSPTFTRTPTATPGPSATFTPTSTFTPTMTSGPSPTLSPTFTRTPTLTPLPSATSTPTSTFTPTITTGPSVTPSPTATPLPIAGPLSVSTVNPRYFADPNGNIIYLTGSHTWCEFMDCGSTNPPVAFNYTAFLDFLVSKNHNFFRLWRAENSRGGEAGDNFWFNPMPYQRSSSECCAFDGGNKFDLNQFNQAYFDRMRQRIIQAGDRGIYVSVMLFDGWSVESKFSGHEPWKGHPYKLSNNVNGINGDGNNDGQGGETHTLADPQVTALQEAYVRKVIDTVNDLDNVLYEISNESPGNSEAWQYHMINLIKSYEAGKPKQHPVGMTAEYPNSSNTDLFNSPADWISPGGDTSDPPTANGSKVILADTDHLCGICGNRQWVWKSFTRGENPIFMDIYDNATSSRGMPFTNAYEVEIRNNLGYARSYATRINLAAMTPRPDLCSTGYCLANPAAAGAEYLMYLPNGGSATINLSASPGAFFVEWLNPATGAISSGNPIQGGATRQVSAPFAGDAVVFLKGELLPTATPSPSPTATPSNTETPTSSPAPSSTSTPTFTPLPAESTLTPNVIVTLSPTSTMLPPEVLYLSSRTNGRAGGVTFADEDILSYDRMTGVWSMYLDGSDLGISGDIDSFALLPDGSILLSLDTDGRVVPLGMVDDSDIIRFIPTQLGATTAGSFTRYFDGSDVGLTTTTEDVDAIGFAPDGRLLISTSGSYRVNNISGNDEDLLAFRPTRLGATTRGTWSLYFDGSDVGLNQSPSEQINEVWMDPVTHQMYLTTVGAFSVPGVSGKGSDIFICTPSSLGRKTTCSFSSFWIGALHGFAGEIIDGLELAR